MTTETDETSDRLRSRPGVDPSTLRVLHVPYRICPLGAHVDHQGGAVTAMAVDRRVTLAYAPSGTSRSRIESLDFPGAVDFDLNDVPPPRPGEWGNLPRGAAHVLKAGFGIDRGVEAVVSGRLHGGGVSSSAAVGLAFLTALEVGNGLSIPALEKVRLGRAMENEYLGLRSGILDQAAILFSRRGRLTRIDCRDASHETIAPGSNLPEFCILLAFSGMSRPLVGTDYNRRVDECREAAVALLAACGRSDEEPLLGRLSFEDYLLHGDILQGPPARRAKHFFEECERVSAGVAAWRSGNLDAFGRFMTASGESSIANYECGSPPLIELFRLLVASDGVFGARFSGAGFRGCCVALVRPEAAEAAAERVSRIYAERRPEYANAAGFEICDTADGLAPA